MVSKQWATNIISVILSFIIVIIIVINIIIIGVNVVRDV